MAGLWFAASVPPTPYWTAVDVTGDNVSGNTMDFSLQHEILITTWGFIYNMVDFIQNTPNKLHVSLATRAPTSDWSESKNKNLTYQKSIWKWMRETGPLTNVTKFWAGWAENWSGQVEFYVEHIRDICFQKQVLQKFNFPHSYGGKMAAILWSIPRVLVPWFLASPGHQQPLYCVLTMQDKWVFVFNGEIVKGNDWNFKIPEVNSTPQRLSYAINGRHVYIESWGLSHG